MKAPGGSNGFVGLPGHFVKKGNLMVRSRVRNILLLIIISMFGLLLWTVWTDRKERSIERFEEAKRIFSPNPIDISGLSLHQYQSGLLTAKISAERFSVASRKFGIFSILPLREATFIHPKVEIFQLQDAPSKGINLFPFFPDGLDGSGTGQESFFSNEIGVVTRILLKNLELQIYKEGKLAVKVFAREGTIHPAKKDFQIYDVTMENPGLNRMVKGPRAVWNGRESRFHFPGTYSLRTAGGEEKGRGLALDLDFNIKTTIGPSR